MLSIGTCSWKYKSWQGIVYSENAKQNFLFEYSKKYNSNPGWNVSGLSNVIYYYRVNFTPRRYGLY